MVWGCFVFISGEKMLKLSSISLKRVFTSFVYAFLLSFSVYANDKSVKNNKLIKPSSAPVIVVGKNINKNDHNILITDSSYDRNSGFSKD